MRKLSSQISSRVLSDEGEVDITPLLDVVFIMLIFFIVTASFVKESGIDVFSPDPLKPQTSLEHPPIVLEINSNNEIFINHRQLDLRAVRPTIVRLKAEQPEASVAVKVSPTAKTKTVVGAIDGIRAAKVLRPSVTLASS